ncbi:hypothetical protein LUZ61_019181 [Rhynchospora tenuis]|uniref:Exostosin GT47 domain-containing protein n=1 Tax=Rhynchospora tenuis TaxID=198213 RepID=A0AAD6EMM5_9POAL|nr:hypothetical protein LUZ61_019181 [Rhynchospora tenuis]
MMPIRRRSATASYQEELEKSNEKPPQPRICCLISLSAMFWVLILTFHFSAFSSPPIIGPDQPSGKHQFVVEEPSIPNVPKFDNPNIQKTQEEPENPSLKVLSIPPQDKVPQPKPVNNLQEPDNSENQVNDQNPSGTETEPQPSQSTDQTPVTQDTPEKAPKNFALEKALRTAENQSDPCGGRYIYVHNLPSRFNDDMLRDCKKLSLWTNMCKFMINDGLGPPLDNSGGVFSDTGWYATNQFAVDVIFNNRMKQYECLTNDSSIAAAIFVPFYAGFDIARYLWGYNISMRDAASLDLVNWLENRPEWKLMGGKDHFLVAGRITWDFRRLTENEMDWGNKLLFLPAARNMSMLVVESSPWNANDFGIPYPTYFHPAMDADVFIWQERMRKLERQWLFSFAGAPRPDNLKSIRGQIIDQCRKSSMCKLLECDFGESKCHSPSSIMKMFQSSLFCLQPQGDSYTRRSAFDSMLAGCIPVFFHPGSAYVQYTWHLPKNYTRYSVFIPENDVRNGNVNIEERLRQYSPLMVKQMREEVINLIPNLIYADPRSKLETLKDAFDVAVDAIINKVAKIRRDMVEGREDKDFIEENSWKYALLDEGEGTVGPHEWDPFFSKPKDGSSDTGNSASAEAAKNSWKSEQRSQKF